MSRFFSDKRFFKNRKYYAFHIQRKLDGGFILFVPDRVWPCWRGLDPRRETRAADPFFLPCQQSLIATKRNQFFGFIPERKPFHTQPSGRRIWAYSCCRGRRDKSAARVAGNTVSPGRARCDSAPVHAESSGDGSRIFFRYYQRWRCVCNATLGEYPRVTIRECSSRKKEKTPHVLVSCYRLPPLSSLPQWCTLKSGRNRVQFGLFLA